MVSEQQKYDSGMLRNLGFAFLAPIGSIIFQAIVFRKSFLEGNLFFGIIVCVVGVILLYLGRFVLEEKKRE